jgi:hypothetical protein
MYVQRMCSVEYIDWTKKKAFGFVAYILFTFGAPKISIPTLGTFFS